MLKFSPRRTVERNKSKERTAKTPSGPSSRKRQTHKLQRSLWRMLLGK